MVLDAKGASEQPCWEDPTGTAAVAAPLLAELALRVSQARLLVDQGLALGLAGPAPPPIAMPLSYQPATTGTLCHVPSSPDDASARAQYVRLVVDTDGERREEDTVPDMLYKHLTENNKEWIARLQKDPGKDRDDEEGVPCQHADRGRAFRRGGATSSGVITFLCEHCHVVGTALQPPCTPSLCAHRVLLALHRLPLHEGPREFRRDRDIHEDPFRQPARARVLR